MCSSVRANGFPWLLLTFCLVGRCTVFLQICLNPYILHSSKTNSEIFHTTQTSNFKYIILQVSWGGHYTINVGKFLVLSLLVAYSVHSHSKYCLEFNLLGITVHQTGAWFTDILVLGGVSMYFLLLSILFIWLLFQMHSCPLLVDTWFCLFSCICRVLQKNQGSKIWKGVHLCGIRR